MDVVSALRSQRMNPYRWSVVLLCVVCGVVDGLDLLLVPYALPYLPDGFIGGGEKGLLISVGFVGYAIGSVVVAPMADRIGRKPVIVLGLVGAGACMLLGALSPNAEFLMVTRLLSGIAIGAVLPLLHVLGDECSSQNRRGLAVGLITLGYPVGTTLGGFASLVVIRQFDSSWQSLFIFGALFSFVVAAIAFICLPESPVFLAERPDDRRLDSLVRRMGLVGVDTSIPPKVEAHDDTDDEESAVGVLAPQYRARSLLIWFGYTFGIAGSFFISSWTPQLISDATSSQETGALMATVISFGAIIGAFLMALATMKIIPVKLCWISIGISVIGQIVFAMNLQNGVAYVAAVILGMGMSAGLAAYMTSAPRLYPAAIRARALGLMGGISRIGAIAAPLLVGVLLAVVSPKAMYLTASMVVLLSGVIAFVLWRHSKSMFDDSEENDVAVPLTASASDAVVEQAQRA